MSLERLPLRVLSLGVEFVGYGGSGPLMAALKESAAVKGASVNPRSRMKLGTLSVPLETKQGEASHMGGRLARVYAKLNQSAENQLGRVRSGSLGKLVLSQETCLGTDERSSA